MTDMDNRQAKLKHEHWTPPAQNLLEEKERWSVDMIECSHGQMIIREGEEGDHAYVIQEGEVEVFKKNPMGKVVYIAKLGPNEIFGELCLFEPDSKRSASVRVTSDKAVVMAISKKNFQRQIDALPDGMRTIIRIMVQRLRNANTHISLLT